MSDTSSEVPSCAAIFRSFCPIEGERIRIERIRQGFASDIFKEFTPELTRYMIPKPPDKIEDSVAFIDYSIAQMEAGLELVCVILDKEDHSFLGCCGFHADNPEHVVEFGIWLKLSAHGKRFGREAFQLLANWFFNGMPEASIFYPVDKANISSRSIPETFGGVIVGEEKKTSQTGVILDTVVYRINRKGG